MKWLIKEGALQFETMAELTVAIKIVHDLFESVRPKGDADDIFATFKEAQAQQDAPAQQTTAAQVTAPAQPAAQPAQTVAPAQQTAPAQETVQATTPQQQTAQVPTAGTQYTIEDIQLAARAVMDRGNTPALTELLQEFGVIGIAYLKPEQIGPFATRLRAIGGDI